MTSAQKSSKGIRFSGIRWQIIRALRSLSRGEYGMVRYKIPNLNVHIDNKHAREKFFESLKNPELWMDREKLEFIVMPGTWFPAVIGPILLDESMLSIKSGEAHWVPKLRYFTITEAGRESLARGEQWWSSMNLLQKIWVIFTE